MMTETLEPQGAPGIATELPPPKRRRWSWFAALVEVPAVAILLVGMVHITAHAVLRATNTGSIPNTLEIVQYGYMPVLALLGFLVAARKREHIVADLVFDKFPEPTKRFVAGGFLAVVAVLMLGFAWFGWSEARNALEIGKHAGITDIPAWPVYFLIPAVFVGLCIQFGVQAYGSIRGSEPAGGAGAETGVDEPVEVHLDDESVSAATASSTGSRFGWTALTIALVLTVGTTIGMFMPLVREAIGVLAIVQMVTLIFLRVPVAAAMMLPSLLGLYALRGEAVAESALATIPYHQVANWSLSVIPMFVLMGLALWRAGLTEHIYAAAQRWLGWAPGGLAVGTNLAGAGLASVSGSTVGTTFALTRIGVPEMLKAGYDKRLALGSIIVAGLPGQLIPPSIMMVIYAGIAEVPVGPQLVAGVGPGLLVAAAFTLTLMGFALRWAPKAPLLRPDAASDVGWRARWMSLVRIWPLPIILAIIVWGMFSGVFTATEAGAAAAAGSCLVLLLLQRRNRPFAALGQAALTTVASVGAIFFLLVGVSLLSRMFTLSGITTGFAELIETMDLGRVQFLLLMVVVYLILGMFLESMPMLVLTVPILIPTLEALDISLLWFGVFAVFMGELAVITPPVGILSYIIYGIVRDPDVNLGHRITLGDVFRSVAWFMPMAIVVVLALILVPEIATYLPSRMSP